jgi:hypothetical protein
LPGKVVLGFQRTSSAALCFDKVEAVNRDGGYLLG